jgi:hypothetical protein
MSHRTAAIALAFSLAVATTGVAQAQSTTPAPAPEAPAMGMKMPDDAGPRSMMGSMISLREVAAIGTGVIVGAALWHVVIGHSFILAGAAVGGWVGDWCYGTHMTPPPVRVGG